MATFVLVHGAGHGGWAWRRLTPLLRRAGHDVHAPTLTGLGERSHLASSDVDMETHVTDVLSVLFFEDLREVVLVGHSYGGVVITAAAHRDPSRIGRLVYLDAPIPADGERSVDLLAPEHRDEQGQLPPPPPGERMARLGITDPSDAAWVGARLRPQPPGPQLQPLRLSLAEAAALPRTLVFCGRTPENFPAARFRQRLDAAGASGYLVLDEGHDAMLTAPERVAELLLPLAGP
ncbi:MAG: alpha/beta fold hydrolase [Chloroflexi bacterium]|nr:alpha/beta fold hydrolase [Chloroflexota bacterium]